MSLDKFGRYTPYSQSKRTRSIEKITSTNNTPAFTLDHDENINIHYKRIKKLKPPVEAADAVNKEFVNKALNEFRNQIGNEIADCKKRFSAEIDEIYKHIKSVRESLEEDIQVYTQYVDKRMEEAKL